MANSQKRNFSSQKKRVRLVDISINNASTLQNGSEGGDNGLLRPPTELEYNSIVDKYSKH